MVEILEYSPEHEPWFCFVDNVGFGGFDSPYTNDKPTVRYPEDYVHTFLAREDELIVGYISLSENCSFGQEWSGRRFVEINGIAVIPPYRRRGIGQHLLEEAIDWCEKSGYERLYAFITSSARQDLHGFYKNAGFHLEKTMVGLEFSGKGERVQMSAESYWNYQQGLGRHRRPENVQQPHNHLPPHSIGWVGFIYGLDLLEVGEQLEFE